MGNPARPGAGVTVDIFVIQAVRQLHDLSGSRSMRDLRAKSESLLGTCGVLVITGRLHGASHPNSRA